MASEKITGQETVTPSGIPGRGAGQLDIKDEAGILAARALACGTVDEETSRKVRRKIDIRILPFLCITYALMFIDKTSLGYSSVYRIIPDNKLQGQNYSWASSIFYFGIAIIQRFPVAKFLGANVILWGAILMTLCLLGHVGSYVKSIFYPGVYIYLILGSLTIVWGIAFTLFVPDGPASRVIGNKTGTKSRRVARDQVIEAITDPKVIVLGLISFVNAIASGGLSFGSLIVSGFGFDPLQTTLLNLPISAVQVIAQLGSGVVISYIGSSRLHVGSIAMIPPVCTILHCGDMIGSYPVGFLIILGLLATNIAGSTKRSVASGWVFVCYCVGQIAGPQFFVSKEAPAYHGGIIAMLCGFILNLVLNQVLRFLYVLENKKRDKILEGKSEDELNAMERESNLQGFEDVSDKNNVMFRYAL
ncbi:MFS general substrate transporter [Daldinia caldariorum]|uniref:MFS general substrate transporter n=1 Tax=Daldinia caldariorum TaxID=326644 RepID=UPI0020088E6D|nr:MFS general substrate transporter [Daldinia caldariorum]KAI1470599.1 MFS general substrate transporter [Daldinia caldariorum]